LQTLNPKTFLRVKLFQILTYTQKNSCQNIISIYLESLSMGIAIAIDGPAGSGKSTLAKAIARKLNYTHIDTGAMYRALTLLALRHSVDWEDENSLVSLLDRFPIIQKGEKTFIDSENVSDEIRSPAVSEAVSIVCRHSAVRRRMVELQRALAITDNVVMDGRDIGTVVLPNAPIKLFVVAAETTRAQRRLDELSTSGVCANLETTLSNIRKRDTLDSSREVSPLRKADGAIEIDTSSLTVEQELAIVEKLIANLSAATQMPNE